jgi:cystathionine beta-lyase
MNEGSTFGEEGAGFMRMNIGCPLSTLKQALEQLLEAYNEITGMK